MRADAKTRVRARIRARLEELGMTGRDLARQVGRSDAWISGILSGAQGLAWEDVDAVADALKLSPSELVRLDESELRELKPHEMRLLRHYQQWPGPIQERWLRVLDYFAATAADDKEARLLDLWRDLPEPDRRRLRWLLERQFRGTPPRTDAHDTDPPRSGAESSAPDTKRPDRLGRIQSANHTPTDDGRDADDDPKKP